MKTVLLVEDSTDDIFTMQRACQRTGIPHELHVVTSGEAALDYLKGTRDYADRVLHPIPDLIFLDLHLPKLNGLAVLEWIRLQPGLKNLPVVMLTGSQAPEYVDQAYKLGITSYLLKIECPAEFGQAVRIILKYWLQLNVRPLDLARSIETAAG